MNLFKKKSPAPLFRAPYDAVQFEQKLATAFTASLLNKTGHYDIVIVCVGTDRSTGDALGPLIGTKLEMLKPYNWHIFGTLDEPVHALNLQDNINHIRELYDRPYIVAIDACLGDLQHVGTVTLAQGALKPGAAVQKTLPEVGDLHLTGIVNVGGFMEYFVLQNTRLSLVMHMADKISTALYETYGCLSQKKEADDL
jgi:putative sporulation protein YyaC